MIIGYARVSTADQNPALQYDALEKAGCERVFSDKISGTIADRPNLNKVRDLLRKGDVLVVYRLDRLGRSLKDLIEWVAFLEKQGVTLKSLSESLDTNSATGKLVFHMFGALAEFERSLMIERTLAGLESARARGRHGGRPYRINEAKRKMVIDLYWQKKPLEEICQMAGISKQTLYSYVRKAENEKKRKSTNAEVNKPVAGRSFLK
jgi:DNA invertase Pin-like site-specific DNA recombinase